MKCGKKCEVWSRVCGYFRPVNKWNLGKKSEFTDRKEYVLDEKTVELLKKLENHEHVDLDSFDLNTIKKAEKIKNNST